MSGRDAQDREILREWEQTRDVLAIDTSDVFQRLLERSERQVEDVMRQSIEGSARLALLSEESDLLVSLNCTASDRCVFLK